MVEQNGCILAQRFWVQFVNFEKISCIDSRIYDSDADCEHLMPPKIGGSNADRGPDLAHTCGRAVALLKLRQRFNSRELAGILNGEKINESEIMAFLESHPRT